MNNTFIYRKVPKNEKFAFSIGKYCFYHRSSNAPQLSSKSVKKIAVSEVASEAGSTSELYTSLEEMPK